MARPAFPFNPFLLRRSRGGERRLTELLRASAQMIAESRHSVDRLIDTLDALIALDRRAIDALAVFALEDDELHCRFARGPRAQSFVGRRLRCDGESLPARGLRERRCITSPNNGPAVTYADRSAIAVPWIEDGVARAVVYAASVYPSVSVAPLAPLLALGSQPFAIARECERRRREADLDELTGLYASRAFRRNLDAVFRYATLRRPQPVVCLWFVDADGFKSVNDRLGHREGDRVLQTLGRLIRAQTVDGFDIAARNGGDEFCLLARSSTKTKAIQRAQTLCEAVRRHAFALSGVTVSVGVAAFPHDAASAAELLEVADRAMYHSKRTGCNRVSYRTGSGRWASVQSEAGEMLSRTSCRWEERSGASFSERSLR